MDRDLRGKWLSDLVDDVMKQHAGRARFSNLSDVNMPKLSTYVFFVLVFAILVLFSLLALLLMPGKLFLASYNLKDYFLTILQVQGTIAAVALPLLIVVIEFSKDDRYVLVKRPEVLMRESWVFPIIAFALLGVAKIGLDIVFFLNELVFWLDIFLVLIGTVIFTIVAYARMLSALLNPRKMKKGSVKLIMNMVERQLDKTMRLRIARNLFSDAITKNSFEFRFVSRGNNAQFLTYGGSGYLSNINVIIP